MDAALRRYLDERAALDASLGVAASTDWERARATRSYLATLVALRGPVAGLPNDVSTEDVVLGASLSGRLFLPCARGGSSSSLALLVYFHGGGWVSGGPATHDPFCRLLARAASAAILLVDYRLAPEHPHPAALEDGLAAVATAAREARSWCTDPSRLVVAGDSAGANVAAALTNRLAAAGAVDIVRAQVLLFPATDHPSGGHASFEETGYGFGADFMRWCWRQYASAVSPDDPDVSISRRATVPQLPPTFVATAEHDILRDEGIAYVDKLRAAGVAVTHLHAPDMHHNFFVNPATVGRFPQCQAALASLADWLRRTALAAPENVGAEHLPG